MYLVTEVTHKFVPNLKSALKILTIEIISKTLAKNI